MDRLVQARLVVAGIGIVVWGVGHARADADIRLVGIVILAISLVMRWGARFAPKRQEPKDDAS